MRAAIESDCPEQVRIFFVEDFVQDAGRALKGLALFLDVDASLLRMEKLIARVDVEQLSDDAALQSFDFAGHFCLVLPLLGPALQLRPPGSPEGAASTASAASEPGRWGLGQLRKLTAQLVTTLLFLGRHTVIHADLKPENILLCVSGAGGRAAGWVVDFGNAVGLAPRRRSAFRYADVAGCGADAGTTRHALPR